MKNLHQIYIWFSKMLHKAKLKLVKFLSTSLISHLLFLLSLNVDCIRIQQLSPNDNIAYNVDQIWMTKITSSGNFVEFAAREMSRLRYLDGSGRRLLRCTRIHNQSPRTPGVRRAPVIVNCATQSSIIG
jgi:hypothetical protein